MVSLDRKPLVVGNWKMHGLSTDIGEIVTMSEVIDRQSLSVDVGLCLPATLIARAGQALPVVSKLAIGGQDCHAAESGAHTGDISAAMMSDAGAAMVIIGHSERRADHGETSEMVAKKTEAVLSADLLPIVCVGETRAEREGGQAERIVTSQISASLPGDAASRTIVIAYEPVWAIGTGLVPTLDDIADMHRVIRDQLAGIDADWANRTRILYGGSVKPDNAAGILAVDGVDGALVGGASLKASDFLKIVDAAQLGNVGGLTGSA